MRLIPLISAAASVEELEVDSGLPAGISNLAWKEIMMNSYISSHILEHHLKLDQIDLQLWFLLSQPIH